MRSLQTIPFPRREAASFNTLLGPTRVLGGFARVLGSMGVFIMSMVLMLVVCIWSWDAFVNGKLYYCTDGGTMDFVLCDGTWAHHPDSVAQVVPRPMDQPDEIKNGWSNAGLWCLWSAFAGVSVLLSAVFARALWRATAPDKSLQPTATVRYEF